MKISDDGLYYPYYFDCLGILNLLELCKPAHVTECGTLGS